jgi:hypothetical protein
MFSRAAVSLYPVNKFGTGRLFAAFLAADGLPWMDFSVSRKTVAKKQKGRHESRPSAIHS